MRRSAHFFIVEVKCELSFWACFDQYLE